MRKVISLLTIFAIAISLTACGASYSGSETFGAVDNGYFSESESYNGWAPDYEIPQKGESVGTTSNNSNSKVDDYLASQKLVYTCNMRLETKEFDETITGIHDLITKYQGFIESNNTSDSAYDWYYSSYSKHDGTLEQTMVVRIPSNNYRDFVDGLSGMAKVRSKDEKVTNITKSYNDTSTTIKSLQIQEERLLDMMEQAETISDMITVESRLSEIQRQLEYARSYLNGMDLDIQFSTVTITIEEVVEYSPNVVEVTYGERLLKSISESTEGFIDFLGELLIAAIFLFPYAVLTGVIVFVIVKIAKASEKKNRKSNQTKVKHIEPVPYVKKEQMTENSESKNEQPTETK